MSLSLNNIEGHPIAQAIKWSQTYEEDPLADVKEEESSPEDF